MKKIIDLSPEEARTHFLKGSSYFNSDFPNYLSFEPILLNVARVLDHNNFLSYKKSNPNELRNVNYQFLANKDGRFAWRPFELINPAIYVSLVNEICDPNNWAQLQNRFIDFEAGCVTCCSVPVIPPCDQKDAAAQIECWWQNIEQKSLELSFEFSHVLNTDVMDCYGSLYTHSIPWAIHGLPASKFGRGDRSLFGNNIDFYIQSSRYGQTNGISQGSLLMDFIAELVLGYVDEQIALELQNRTNFRILRYRDDYRIFANSDEEVEEVLKVISKKLMEVGMKLGVSKTVLYRNIVEGSIKPDKLAGIDLQDLGITNAKTIQKQLLRLHSFGQRFPNSGALRRLVSDFYDKIFAQTEQPDDLEVIIAIATDIGFMSPSTFPAIAGILSCLLSKASAEEKKNLWGKIVKKMRRVPYNGYLEIWLQRIVQPESIDIVFESDESICKIVNGETVPLWDNSWISSAELLHSLDSSNIFIKSSSEVNEIIQPEEIVLFTQKTWTY